MNQIERIEKMRTCLTDNAAYVLAEVFDVDKEYLLGETDYKTRIEEVIAHSNNTENVQSRLFASLFALLASIGIEIIDKGHCALSNHGTKIKKLSPDDMEYDVRDAHTIYKIVVNGKTKGYIKDTDLLHLANILLSTLKTQAETFASSFDIIAESERIEYLEMADRSSKEFLKNKKETPNQTKTKP